MPDLFKLGFPAVTLPPNRGGKRGALIFSMSNPRDPSLAFAWVVDSDGVCHQNVPYAVSELRNAKVMVLVEDPSERAPQVGGSGSGLVAPDGRKL